MGRRYDIIVVAEGAKQANEETVVKDNKIDMFGHKNVGGVGEYLSREINDALGIESRSIALGHIQRGGAPCSYDRRMGRYYGIAAANLIFRNEFGKMVSYKDGKFATFPLEGIIGRLKLVDINTMYDINRYNGDRNILPGC